MENERNELENEENLQINQVQSANLLNVIGSIATEEIGLRILILAEANKIQAAIGVEGVTIADLIRINRSVTRTMKTVLLKNTILERKLRDVLNTLREQDIATFSVQQLLIEFANVIGSIFNEENALAELIQAEADKINTAIPIATTVEELVELDQSVRALMKIIVQKNFILQRKLRNVIQFIEFLISENVVLPITIQNVINNLILLINAISNEETSLGALIESEAQKIDRAGNFGPTTEQRLEINNSVGSIVDTIVQKNMILEAKLEDVLSLFRQVELNEIQIEQIENSLSNIVNSIAVEEEGLGNLIALVSLSLLSTISNISNLSTDVINDLIQANENTTNLIESITLKNMVLEAKLEEALDFINNL
ncbi:hypothetical protein [Neobacillus niacini]|jgi:hypothetical protein|uniref:hypothetical protein n=1 Tax=Neobacillus niacini TaxID=86668 RepID=UPI001C8EE0D9|nr:hypothetical protein [Neobacillus niacini]MBY0147831.1 hypothetical protein [Neobacillus niacini]